MAFASCMSGEERYELALSGRRAVLERRGADPSTIEAEMAHLQARIAHWKDLPAMDVDVFERLRREVTSSREEALEESARAQEDEWEATWTKRAREQVRAHEVRSRQEETKGRSVRDRMAEAGATWQEGGRGGCQVSEGEAIQRQKEEAEETMQHWTMERKQELYRHHVGFRRYADKLGIDVGDSIKNECKGSREALKRKITQLREQAGRGKTRPHDDPHGPKSTHQEYANEDVRDLHRKDEL